MSNVNERVVCASFISFKLNQLLWNKLPLFTVIYPSLTPFLSSFLFFFYRAKLVSIVKLFKWVEIGAQLTYRFSVDFSLLVPFSCFMNYVLNFSILSSGWLQHGMIRWIHIGALFVHRFFFSFSFLPFYWFLFVSLSFCFIFISVLGLCRAKMLVPTL